MVGIVTVNTNTYIKDKVFDGEFILNITGHVDRFESANVACVHTVGILFTKKIVVSRLIFQLVAFIVETVVINVRVTIVPQLVGRKHVNIKKVFIELNGMLVTVFVEVLDGLVVVIVGVDGDKVKAVNRQAQFFTKVFIESTLCKGIIFSIIDNGVNDAIVLNQIRIIFIKFHDMEVGKLTH